MQGVIHRAGGSSFINGVIEEYKVAAGENISAGDFVEYVNEKIYDNQSDIQISNDSSATDFYAAKLNNEKIFLMYRYAASDKGYTIGRICLIKSGVIQLGIETQLFESEYYPFSLVALNENKIIAFSRHVDYGYALICTIDDMDISVVNSNSNVTGSFSSYNQIYTVALGENQILMLNGDSCSIYTINTDNTITKNNSIVLGTNISKSCLIKLAKNKMFIVFSKRVFINNKVYFNTYGNILNINNGNMSLTSDIKLDNVSHLDELTFLGISLNGNKALIFSKESTGSISKLVCSINDNLITVETNEMINSNINNITAVSRLSQNQIIVFTSTTNSFDLDKYIIYSLKEDNLIEDIEEIKTTGECCFSMCNPLMIAENILFLPHSHSKGSVLKNHIMLFDNRSRGLYKVKSLVNSITGIAKTSGIEGDTIKVIVPE